MPWKSALVAAALVLGGGNMTAQMAFGRGMSERRAFCRWRLLRSWLAISHGFVRPFRRNFAFRRRNFATGGWWPYDYDYGPTDAYGDIYPATVGAVPEPKPAPVCHCSEEIVKVPAERGGTRQIKIIRCP
jgi:hypothetical protein